MDLTSHVAKYEEFSVEEALGPLSEVERKHAPAKLFVAGDCELLSSDVRVSIIGSRKASRRGLENAANLARELCKRGAVIVSGLAAGIDTAAHKAAMEAGGRTIAVIGTPLDRAYPLQNQSLQERIMREHVVVSQFPTGGVVHRSNFPRRNITMALSSDATVIVEAGERSGTRYQGWETLRLGRPLFFMDSFLDSCRLSWPWQMIGRGAQSISVREADALIQALHRWTGKETSQLTF